MLFVAHPQGRKKKGNNFGVGSLVFIKGGARPRVFTLLHTIDLWNDIVPR